MASAAESQAFTVLGDNLYDDPSQLSQLLRQRSGNEKAVQFTTSTDSQSFTSAAPVPIAEEQSNHEGAPPQVPDVPTHVLHETTRRASRYVKPKLPTYHTAPTRTGIVMERPNEQKMHQSFGDVPGDTQPDSQIYRQWTSGILGNANSSHVVPQQNPKSLFDLVEEEEADAPADGTGMVESSQQHSQTITSPTVLQEDDRGTHFGADLPLTSPLKFETPALAGRKRDSQGQVLSSAWRTNTTPGTVLSASAFAGFGNAAVGQPMSLTQVFNATQAGTSPIVDASNEDAVFQRPSPNFTNARNSSPILAASSPIKASRPEVARTDPIIRSSSEPRAEYVTMKESQERRKREVEREYTTGGVPDSWDEPSAAQKRAEKRKARERFEREAAKSLSTISAPILPPSRSVKKRTLLSTSPNYRTPTVSRATRRAFSDGPLDDDNDSMDELSQRIPVNSNDNGDSLDELSQDYYHSARGLRTPAPTIHRNTNNTDNNINKIQVPKTSSHPRRTQSGQSARNSSQLQSPSLQTLRDPQYRTSGSQSLRAPSRPQNSKESIAILDSQPDATAEFDSIPRPKSLRFPSSPSINQYSINQTTITNKTGYTSQVSSSSIPPMPPRSSSPELGDARKGISPDGHEERVPSSPPIIHRDEDDISYDEHAYDEHSAGEAEDGELELHSDDEDIDMDDQELRTPKSEEALEIEEGLKYEDVEVDPSKLIKVDNETGHEAQAKLEQETAQQPHRKEELALSRHSEERGYDTQLETHPEAPARRQRQSTIPESDALDETQPSFFPAKGAVAQNAADTMQSISDRDSAPNQTNSTEPFHTAREKLSRSQSNKLSNEASDDGRGEDANSSGNIRSLNDIANLPGTQQSTHLSEIEMPQLSFTDETNEDLMSVSSPVRPSKRRKVTYGAKSKAFRSPIKETDPVSDVLLSSPLKQVQIVQGDSSPSASAQKREVQGALAATHAREEAVFARPATRKSTRLPKSAKLQPQKKGALKPVKKGLFNQSPNTSPESKHPKTPEASKAFGPSSEATATRPGDTDMRPVDNAPNGTDELTGPTPQPTGATVIEPSIEPTTNEGEAPTGGLLVPNRVFAYWPGKILFYPATCIGRADSNHLQIRYDDGNVHPLETVQIRALDLRPGDHVKVDQVGMKRHTYVVIGLKDKIEDARSEDFPLTDRHGYATVILEEKQRDSLPKAEAVETLKRISVPLAKVYLTNQLWGRIRDRGYKFTPTSSPSASTSQIATPSIPEGAPTVSRRGTVGPSLLKEATARAGSVASSVHCDSTVFSNMAFSITLTEDDKDASNKNALIKLIKSNSGQVLDNGFHELFKDFESVKASSSSQSRASPEPDGLVLKNEYKELGFVGLISDSHSRRTKHVQALALDIPVLHFRWLHDSLAASRPLPFAKYLLPAGLSTYLDPKGTVKSRVMRTYDPSGDITFSKIIAQRELLLHDQSVLLVTGKTKKDIERKQPYVFLTHALGPDGVGRCTDLPAAKQMLKDREWDWVHVDGGTQGVADADAVLFGNGTVVSTASKARSGGRKRKRDESTEAEVMVRSGMVGNKKIRIMCDEFVIQSLILGALIEE